MRRKAHNRAERVARGIALDAHHGQRDRAGTPYWVHLATVAGLVRPGVERTAAWLHDVLEDTDRTAEDLRRAGVDGEVVAVVEALTRRDGETYARHIERVAASGPAAVAVKRADLADHLARRSSLSPGLEKRYRKATETLDRSEEQRGRERSRAVPERRTVRIGRHEYRPDWGGRDGLVPRIGRWAERLAADLAAGTRPEEQCWKLTRAASAALDALETDERSQGDERTYAEVVHPKGRPPKRGETFAAFPALGATVRVEGVWPLPDASPEDGTGNRAASSCGSRPRERRPQPPPGTTPGASTARGRAAAARGTTTFRQSTPGWRCSRRREPAARDRRGPGAPRDSRRKGRAAPRGARPGRDGTHRGRPRPGRARGGPAAAGRGDQ